MEENRKIPAENADKKQDSKKEKTDKKDKNIHNNALYAASLGRAATKQVDPHTNRGLANTGTNISYEGPTSPGAGGSVGTGYTSGKPSAEPRTNADSEYEKARVEKNTRDEKGDKENKRDEWQAPDEVRDII